MCSSDLLAALLHTRTILDMLTSCLQLQCGSRPVILIPDITRSSATWQGKNLEDISTEIRQRSRCSCVTVWTAMVIHLMLSDLARKTASLSLVAFERSNRPDIGSAKKRSYLLAGADGPMDVPRELLQVMSRDSSV